MSLFYFAVMSFLTKTGFYKEQVEQDDVTTKLESKCVPFSLDACRYCADPCDEDHLEYPAKLDIDMEPGMFGTVKPYARQIVISTGRTDWPREVTDDPDSLAHYVAQVNNRRTLERQQEAAAVAVPEPTVTVVGDKAADTSAAPPSIAVAVAAAIAALPVADAKVAVEVDRPADTADYLPPDSSATHPAQPSPPEPQHMASLTSSSSTPSAPHAAEHGSDKWPELWSTEDSAATRLSVLNGSHTASEDGMANVLVLPDYKMIRVEESSQGAEALWENALDPELNLAGKGMEDKTKSFLLPYSCVILLCSHKRRDNRCHIVAPKLLQSFTAQLEYEGWQVDHNIDENYDDWGDSLESIPGTDEEREAEIKRRLADPERIENKRVLILRSSHVGGHKYAGNVVLCFPTGAVVWYGRVTPHEVASIVKNTIADGKVLPKLMRGGMNLSRRPGRCSLLDW